MKRQNLHSDISILNISRKLLTSDSDGDPHTGALDCCIDLWTPKMQITINTFEINFDHSKLKLHHPFLDAFLIIRRSSAVLRSISQTDKVWVAF